MYRCFWIGVLSLFLFGSQSDATAEQLSPEKRLLGVDDFDKTIDVSSPRLSPNGELTVYQSAGKIYMVPTLGGVPRVITSSASGASEPRWSADGKTLYFLSNRSGSSQLWKLPLDRFGEAVQLTEFDFPLTTIDLSPDETRLLLSQQEPWENKDEEGKTEPWVIDRLQFKEDAGDGYITADTPNHYLIYDLEKKSTTQITSGDYSESEAVWSPDGESIAFISNRGIEPDKSYRTDVWVTESSAAKDRHQLLRLSNNEHTKQAPAWSPDGKHLAYITAENGVYGVQHVAIVSSAGGVAKVLTEKLDRWVTAFRFSGDGQWIYLQYDNAGGTHLARIHLRTNEIQPMIQGENVVYGFDIDRSGHIVAKIGTKNRTADIYSLNDSKLTRLSNSNKTFFDALTLGNKEKIVYSSADGTQIEAFVTKPPGFRKGKLYPTILKIHGGPLGQFTYEYDFGTQFFAANGYVVVEPNPRGSTGFGQAFINAIFQSWGITDYDDVIGAVDHVIELGYADPNRLAVFGYSYGGYMTNVVITRSNRFKAAASGAGHSLIIANYGHDIYQKWYNWELGGPWENTSKYELLSPLLRVGEVTTPTIFLGGKEDWNVPVLNAELFYQSLKHKGVPTRLVVYPNSHHGGWDPKFNKDYFSRIVGWFDQYAKRATD